MVIVDRAKSLYVRQVAASNDWEADFRWADTLVLLGSRMAESVIHYVDNWMVSKTHLGSFQKY